ncbi:MAG TPA: ROK family protein [Ornithinibacter sp.]|nr:ROK family protein [Ornithinibacter sp.]
MPPNDHRRAVEATSGARQSSLRASNLALVARTVCASPEPISRAGVAARTSMTRSTASRLVDDLVALGVLDELEPAGTTGPGRPATPLVAGEKLTALGLQVNAGFLAARVVDLRGRVVAERVEVGDFVGSEPEPTLARLAVLAADVLDRMPATSHLVGAGLALPGIVSSGTGTLLIAPNLGWSDVRPGDVLGRGSTLGHRLSVGNEADLASRTVAEVAPGRPGTLSDFIYLSGEIGVGGAIVVDGRIWTGRHGWAGEIGHVSVDPDGPSCPCGSTGCLERYAGKHAILDAAGLPHTAAPAELADRAERGDERARQAVARAARALGIALAGVVNVLDIPAVVFGGHLGQVADLLRPDLERQLRARVLSARWVTPTIVAAPADAASGATGAAMLELSSVLDRPGRWADSRPSPGTRIAR